MLTEWMLSRSIMVASSPQMVPHSSWRLRPANIGGLHAGIGIETANAPLSVALVVLSIVDVRSEEVEDRFANFI
ncbi:uncharacterized protein KRP23_11213 [Phytophthora ramorum]|uniref:uncharacterized protein n=1 Tax=Phytophthora ramorum TaxID=164328 RepID=UPI0030B22D2E|nr:hypothetical protein KRP23_11213 [Phytophthora ramorum]